LFCVDSTAVRRRSFPFVCLTAWLPARLPFLPCPSCRS
jgi:hypothetical protein